MDVPPLACEIIERDGPQARLLVLLHGYGEPAADLVDRLDRIDPGAAFLAVAPSAPFERKGRAVWHRALTAPEEAGRQYVASMAAVDALLGELEVRTGRAARDAVVGGFSQGGGLAAGLLIAAGVEHRPAAGFGVCSFPPHVDGFRIDRRRAAGRPYFLISSQRDHFAPIEASRGGAATLADVGLDVTYAELDDEHVMTDAAASAVGGWLAALDGERPSAPQPLLEGVAPLDRLADLWVDVT